MWEGCSTFRRDRLGDPLYFSEVYETVNLFPGLKWLPIKFFQYSVWVMDDPCYSLS